MKVQSRQIGREFTAGREATACSARSTGTRLISYNTCVAFREGPFIFSSKDGFSATTRKQLSGVGGIRVDSPFRMNHADPLKDWEMIATEIRGIIKALEGKQARARTYDYTEEIAEYQKALDYILGLI